MSRRPRVIVAVALVAVGLVGCVLFLNGQGLDRAEKWVSLVGVFTSAAMSAGGLVLGWLTWRQAGAEAGKPRSVHAAGAGAVAVGRDSANEINTEVSGVAPSTTLAPEARDGIGAGGTGSVAIGGSSTAPIRTKVTGNDGSTTTQ